MEQFLQRFLVQVGADHAQAAGVVRAAVAHVDLARHIVKLEPAARGVLQDAFGAQHAAVFLLVPELAEDAADLVLLVALSGLDADVAEDLVRVVFVRAVVVMVVVMPVAFVIVMVVMVMLMMVFMLIFVVIIVIVIMIVVVMIVVVMIVVVVIMVMLMLVFMTRLTSSEALRKAWAMTGSKCVPDSSRMMPIAFSKGKPGL